MARAQTYTQRHKIRSEPGTFLHTRESMRRRAREPRIAEKAAGHARAARPSRLMIAAAAPRRHSCLGCRHAAPRRLAAAGSTNGSSEQSESSTNSARIESQSAEETPATSAPTMVMAPVALAGLCRRTSNAEQPE